MKRSLRLRRLSAREWVVVAMGVVLGAYSQAYWVWNHAPLTALLYRAPIGVLVGAALCLVFYAGFYARFMKRETNLRIARQAAALDLWSYVFLLLMLPALHLGPLRFTANWTLSLLFLATKTMAAFKLAETLGAKHWTRGLACGLFAVGLTGLFAELGFRSYLQFTQQSIDMITGRKPPTDPERPIALGNVVRACADPLLVYEGQPDTRGLLHGRPVTMNRAGFRGREFSDEKASKCFRILFVGDSYTFGFGVGDEETVPFYLERRLKTTDPSREYEVMNFGIPGWNTIQEVEALETLGLRYRPDLVVVQFFQNDLCPPFFLPKTVNYLNEPGCVLGEWLERRMNAKMEEWRLSGKSKNDGAEGLRVNTHWGPTNNPFPGMEFIPPRYRHLAGWENFDAALGRLKDLVERERLPVVMLSFSAPGETNPQIERVAEMVRGHGVRFHDMSVDFNAAIEASGKPERHWRLWGADFHYSPDGCRLMARLIAERLREWDLATAATAAANR